MLVKIHKGVYIGPSYIVSRCSCITDITLKSELEWCEWCRCIKCGKNKYNLSLSEFQRQQQEKLQRVRAVQIHDLLKSAKLYILNKLGIAEDKSTADADNLITSEEILTALNYPKTEPNRELSGHLVLTLVMFLLAFASIFYVDGRPYKYIYLCGIVASVNIVNTLAVLQGY
jgi:hypothetical protein